MKKSKLFLTASLIVMAIAAVAATRGMRAPLPFYYYQVTNASGAPINCVYVPQQILCQPNPSPVCKYLTYNAYKDRQSVTTCITPLRPE